jgi:cob(I)alamin adenosyltransferase
VGNRLSKIYTRTGDAGTTGLADGSRVSKDSPRVETMGDVDELNSLIGAVLVHPLPAEVVECLTDVQHGLFDIGGELAIPGVATVCADDVASLERSLDRFNEPLAPLKEFILPGGGPAAVAAHVARAVCRRAERRFVALAGVEDVNEQSQRYLNRLSDLLFVLSRVLARAGEGEVYWQPRRNRAGGSPAG